MEIIHISWFLGWLKRLVLSVGSLDKSVNEDDDS